MKSIGRYEGILVKPTKAQDYCMVGQAQSGAYAASVGSSTSGIRNLEEAITQLCEGGYILDKRHLSWEVACECITGPMESVSLPPMTMRDLYEDDVTFGSIEEFYSYLEERKQRYGGREALSMSYLSMDLYAAWWHRKGAKVGRKIKGEIQWKAPYSGPLFQKVSEKLS